MTTNQLRAIAVGLQRMGHYKGRVDSTLWWRGNSQR